MTAWIDGVPATAVRPLAVRSGLRDLTNVGTHAKRREKSAHKVPVPCVSTKSRSRVFQWLELEPFGREPDLAPKSK